MYFPSAPESFCFLLLVKVVEESKKLIGCLPLILMAALFLCFNSALQHFHPMVKRSIAQVHSTFFLSVCNLTFSLCGHDTVPIWNYRCTDLLTLFSIQIIYLGPVVRKWVKFNQWLGETLNKIPLSKNTSGLSKVLLKYTPRKSSYVKSTRQPKSFFKGKTQPWVRNLSLG